jgi:hypothetical protein
MRVGAGATVGEPYRERNCSVGSRMDSPAALYTASRVAMLSMQSAASAAAAALTAARRALRSTDHQGCGTAITVSDAVQVAMTTLPLSGGLSLLKCVETPATPQNPHPPPRPPKTISGPTHLSAAPGFLSTSRSSTNLSSWWK